MEPRANRLAELALYVSERCQHLDRFGIVKLNKILLYADLRSYFVTGKPVSGARYVKKIFGPAPEKMDELLTELEAQGRLRIRHRLMADLKTQQRPEAVSGPDLSGFKYEELQFVEDAIDFVRDMSAHEVSERTHEFVAWKVAAMDDVIPYNAFLVQNVRQFKDEELNYGMQLAAQYS